MESHDGECAYTLIVTPSYPTRQARSHRHDDQLQVNATLKRLRRFGSLHSGQSLHASTGKIVWDLATSRANRRSASCV